jgi:hypothetical protein
MRPPNDPPFEVTGTDRRVRVLERLGLQPAATNAAIPAKAVDRNRRRPHSVLTSRA